jgi:hypothetical protein
MSAARTVAGLVFSVGLTACVSPPAEPVMVFIGKSEIQASGRNFNTADELLTFLSEQKIQRIRLRTEEGADYKEIGKVIYSTSRKGLKIESINGIEAK